MDEQLTLEYIFFHQQPYQKFKRFLESKNIQMLKEGIDETDVEGFVIHIQDNLEDDISEQIEDFYDEMMELSETLVADESEDNEFSRVGLNVTLKDGRSVLAEVEPDVLNRILTVVSHQELGNLVDAIADAVENPDQRPLCKRS
jgi:hypothetical protein